MKIILVSKYSLDIEQYMLNLKCQFRYLPQRASLARVGSQLVSERRMGLFLNSRVIKLGDNVSVKLVNFTRRGATHLNFSNFYNDTSVALYMKSQLLKYFFFQILAFKIIT